MTILTALLNPSSASPPVPSGSTRSENTGAPFADVLGQQRTTLQALPGESRGKNRQLDAGTATNAAQDLAAGLPEAMLPLIAQLAWHADSQIGARAPTVDGADEVAGSHRMGQHDASTPAIPRLARHSLLSATAVQPTEGATQALEHVAPDGTSEASSLSTSLLSDPRAATVADLRTAPLASRATSIPGAMTAARLASADPQAGPLPTLAGETSATRQNSAIPDFLPAAGAVVSASASATAEAQALLTPGSANTLPAAATPASAVPAGPGLALAPSHPGWPSHLGQQVLQLARLEAGMPHTAELRLDPPELGPLRITLSLQDGVAHASFLSPHPHVRQAVEQALPQLQQSLAQAGLSLGEANVGEQGSFDHGAGKQLAAGTGSLPSNSEDDDGSADGRLQQATASNALIDTFA